MVAPANAGSNETVATRLERVRERIAAAASRAGRRPEEITLVGASKTVDHGRIAAAIAAGLRDLGENYVQEAQSKLDAPELRGADARWHLIGHLQTNKIKKALEMFYLIHSVDRVALGEAVARRARSQGTVAQVLLQVNVAQKASQFGFAEGEVRPAAERLAAVPGLSLRGLMCIAPEVGQPDEARPYFRRLAELHAGLTPLLRQAGHPWEHLSMGMTNDYPVAIEEGATLVRVGRAIFGERTSPTAPVPGA